MTTTDTDAGRAAKAVSLALAALVVIAAALSFLGFPSWLVLLTAPLPWILLIATRRGVGLATAVTLLVSFWLLLVIMMATSATGMPMLGTVISVWMVAGLAGAAGCYRRASVLRVPSRLAVSTWAPAALGGLIWLGALAATTVIPGASRLSWVMLGDSANNVIFAREVIYRGGVGLGPDANPVPLPSALMAIVMNSGREGVAADALTRHDIAAFAQVWTILIVLTCLTVGAAAGSIVRMGAARPVVVAAVSAGASLLPLSWFFTGYPLEFGFFNTHVALPIVMASFVVYLSTEKHAVWSFAAQMIAATLLLAVWSPLVLLPGFLALAIVVRQWRQLLAARGVELGLLVVAVVQVVGYGLGVVLPSLIAQSHFLSAPGGAFGFRRWMIGGLAIAALVLAVATFRRVRHVAVVGTLSVVVASAVGLGSLLFITRNSANPWSYYPLKFAWLAAVIIVVLIVGLAGAFVARRFRGRWTASAGFTLLAVGTIVFLNWAPSSGLGYVWKEPVDRLVTGEFLGDGDQVAEQIFELATLDQAHVLWKSGDPYEGSINFWVLQLWSDSMTENIDLKHFAYGLYDPDETEDLCAIIDLMGGDVVVHTADWHVEADLSKACAEGSRDVKIESVD